MLQNECQKRLFVGLSTHMAAGLDLRLLVARGRFPMGFGIVFVTIDGFPVRLACKNVFLRTPRLSFLVFLQNLMKNQEFSKNHENP